MALPPPFATPENVIAYVESSAMTTAFEVLKKDASFSRMGLVVVDLTTVGRALDGTIVGGGLYAEHNGGKTMSAQSTIKVAAMVAAFRLWDAFRAAAAKSQGATAEAVIGEVEADWKPLVRKAVGRVAADFPKLARIFSIQGAKGNWTIEFTDTFWSKMSDMVAWSKNEAASYCIQALGYQYINGVMKSEGLYSESAGGMWLTWDFGTGKDGVGERKSGSRAAASGRSLIKMLVLIDTDRMISADHSATMRSLMQNSWNFLAFRKSAKRQTTAHFGKLGKADGLFSEAAVMKRVEGAKSVRYAMVILGSHGSTPLHSLGPWVDDLVFSMH